MVLIGFIVAVVALDYLAMRFGVDSRIERWLAELRQKPDYQ
jgi:hypothetical protein